MALYAFDGTWNAEKDTGIYGLNTNVVEFARAYRGRLAAVQKEEARGGPTVRDDFYVSGPGTRHGWFGKWLGGAFGFGGRSRINEAKAAVAQAFKNGDEEIDVVGFSRGAALALHFTNVVGGESFENSAGREVKAEVRFLGLWDVVAAFGIPLDLGPFTFQRINIGYKLKLPEHVRHCFHAVALDERRDAFRVTRVDNGYQVWFRGVHSDVGGGNENAALSNISLAWMLRKAAKVGLPVDAALADRLAVDAAARVRVAAGGGPMRKFRELTAKDRIHHTVSPRQVPECQNPPHGCPVESASDERDAAPTIKELTGR